MKKKCILCKKEKKENEFSKEHIFPEAIGNRHLVIDNVCRDCNTKILSKIDVFLTDNILTQTRRQWFRVPGKKGYIPNPFGEGFLSEDQRQKVRVIINDSDKLEIEFLPLIIKSNENNGLELISITMDRNKEKELPALINKILSRKNLQELPEDEIKKNIIPITNEKPEIIIKWSFNKIEYKKAIIKIAYELAYYFLGDAYSNDNIGEKIRLFLKDDSTDFSNHEIYGDIDIYDPIIDPGHKCIEEFLNKLEIKDFYHVAYITGNKSDNKISVIIKIFDVFVGIIVISDNYSKYTIPKKDLIIINPQNGKLEILSIEERI